MKITAGKETVRALAEAMNTTPEAAEKWLNESPDAFDRYHLTRKENRELRDYATRQQRLDWQDERMAGW